MQTTFSFQDWFEHLRQLMPIAGLVHVGAGVGRETVQYADWGIPSGVFIEADETQVEKLAAAVHGHPGWSTHTALISASEGAQDFFLATNPNESGVLVPEKLSSFWRNLKTRESQSCKATTLDILLASSVGADKGSNYAVIDCLPALPVLQGAKKILAGWDVIVARVVLDESRLVKQGARKSEVDSYLKGHGFICIAAEEERQPAIGRALYVRDWKAAFQSNNGVHQLQIDQLSKAHEEQAKLATERQAQIEGLKQTRAHLEQEKSALAGRHEEQAKLATERQAQIEGLKQKLTQLEQEKSALAGRHEEQAKLATERLKQINELQQQMQSRQAGEADLAARQQLMHEEMVRAEAQLDLIKDMLLREPGI